MVKKLVEQIWNPRNYEQYSMSAKQNQRATEIVITEKFFSNFCYNKKSNDFYIYYWEALGVCIHLHENNIK